MHPDPLLRMSQEHALEGCVVGARVAANRLARILALVERQRLFEADHVRPVGFARTRGRDDRRAGFECQQGEALKGTGGLAEKIHRDPLRG